MNKRFTFGFSLVEVTLAIGIAAFCLIAVIGIFPVGVQTNRNAASQTRATNIMAAVIADMRATPPTCSKSSQFGISLGTSTTLYFDDEGRSSCDDSTGVAKYQVNPFDCSAGSCSASWSPPLQPRYKLKVTFSQQSPAPPSPAVPTIYADVSVTWPAAATAADANGSTEMFVALDRN